MSASSPVLAEAVAAELERILESQEFARSWRLKALLRYLSGRSCWNPAANGTRPPAGAPASARAP